MYILSLCVCVYVCVRVCRRTRRYRDSDLFAGFYLAIAAAAGFPRSLPRYSRWKSVHSPVPLLHSDNAAARFRSGLRSGELFPGRSMHTLVEGRGVQAPPDGCFTAKIYRKTRERFCRVATDCRRCIELKKEKKSSSNGASIPE